ERLGEPARVEALADRPRIARLVLDHWRAKRLEPRDALVEPLEDQPLEGRIAARALGAEVAERSVAPDHAAREEHRATGPVALLVDERLRAELARTSGGAQTRHPRPCDGYVNENVGLCSTYSTRTRSGPQRKTAYVFAASTTLSISMPDSRASSMWSSAESTSTARWLRSGRSGSPGSPGWNST